jgi:hypothetical protein
MSPKNAKAKGLADDLKSTKSNKSQHKGASSKQPQLANETSDAPEDSENVT